MALPSNTFFNSNGSSFLTPDDFTATIPTRDREKGGVAISDPSQGLLLQDWECKWDFRTRSIIVFPVSNPLNSTVIISGLNSVSKVSFSFDANMRPYIAYANEGTSYFRWYDAVAGDYTTTVFNNNERDLCVTHDIKTFELVQSNVTDVLLFYLRDNKVYYRQQRDRYGLEYQIATLSNNLGVLQKVGLASNNRLQLQIVKNNNTSFVSSP